MWDIVQNDRGKIPENLDFEENSIFITESIEAAVHGCSGIKSQ